MITLNELRKELTRYTYPDNSKEVKRLREENTELLAALKRMVLAFDVGDFAFTSFNGRGNIALDDSRKAIAKVEGKA